MYGICGLFYFDPNRPIEEFDLERMNRRLALRGPDSGNHWISGPIGLGHRRLSISDLSPAGSQPMTNEDGTVVLIFNGEIYNFQDLRSGLQKQGHLFRSNTDSEVIIHLYEEKGVECLQSLRGMFAFALWDAKKRRLFLARDRVGKKPLKYYRDGSRFAFASELKAILALPGVVREVDPRAIHHYFTFGYCPGDMTGFHGIQKLPPAHYMLVDAGGMRIQRYWQLSYTEKQEKSEEDWCEEILYELREAVRLRLVSDVPLGVFLSGGIDSSVVAALAAQSMDSPLKTFSIGFSYEKYNELPYARKVAQKYKTEHHELVAEPKAMDVFPKLVRCFEEPFADSSVLPRYYLAHFARQYVAVTLNGDGGDENFTGYERYLSFLRCERYAAIIAPLGMGMIADRASRLFPISSAAQKLRAVSLLMSPDTVTRYGKLISFFDPYEQRDFYTHSFFNTVSKHDPMEVYREFFRSPLSGQNSIECAQYADFNIYLPGDLLPRVDIATMAHSLESRSPLLDHIFLERTAAIPFGLKIKDGQKKYIFKKAVQDLLPPELLQHPKKGFGIPIHEWFSGELRELAHDTLLSSRSYDRGYLRPEAVRTLLKRHDRGEKLGYYIWQLLFLEEWHRQYIDTLPSA